MTMNSILTKEETMNSTPIILLLDLFLREILKKDTMTARTLLMSPLETKIRAMIYQVKDTKSKIRSLVKLRETSQGLQIF